MLAWQQVVWLELFSVMSVAARLKKENENSDTETASISMHIVLHTLWAIIALVL